MVEDPTKNKVEVEPQVFKLTKRGTMHILVDVTGRECNSGEHEYLVLNTGEGEILLGRSGAVWHVYTFADGRFERVSKISGKVTYYGESRKMKTEEFKNSFHNLRVTSGTNLKGELGSTEYEFDAAEFVLPQGISFVGINSGGQTKD